MVEIKNEPVRRTREIEEVTNLYVFVPLSHWLAPRLAYLKITPNMVSFTGMAFGVAAAVSYFNYMDYRFALLGFLLMGICHVLDGADGALARLTNSQSEFGKIIDGICDYVVYISVYVALALTLVPSYGTGVWFIVVAAGVCHAFQAGAYELQRQEYDFWGYGKKSAELPEIADLNRGTTDLSIFGTIATGMSNIYTRMQYRFSGLDLDFRPALKNYISENPDKLDQFRADYRNRFSSVVRRWGIMCANYRTYAIFLACIMKQPILYFVLELTILNLFLILLVYHQKKHNKGFLQQLTA